MFRCFHGRHNQIDRSADKLTNVDLQSVSVGEIARQDVLVSGVTPASRQNDQRA